jgi:hypothetical protein
MNKITLNARELQEVFDFFNKMNESSDYGTIVLEQSDDGNGIGTILTATMYVTHRDMEGDFKVTITDENDW